MDWIRRNWPDLLIGVALVAVIAGIVITLLSGGSFSLFNRQSRIATTPTTPTPTTTTSPFNNTTTSNATTSNATTNNVATATTSPPSQLPADTAAATTTPDATTPVTTQDPADVVVTTPNTTTGGIEPILPELPIEAPTGFTEPSAVAAPTPAPTTPAPTPAATPAPAVTASTPIPVAAAERSAPYRVSVGAFGQRQNAEELASTFRAQGYPVFVAPENNLFITLVGPYTQEADAVQVADRIRAAGNDALVYRLPEPEPAAPAPVATASTPAPSPAPAPEPVATAVTPAPVETPVAAPAPAPVATATDPDWVNRGGSTVLQVGAYGSLESSLPQRRRLESLGFTVSERFADGLIRLVIGPFDERELAVVQAQLAVNGIDNFPVP
ncbi:MAG: SPOR domain-containing protein [Deinococcota bacterium]